MPIDFKHWKINLKMGNVASNRLNLIIVKNFTLISNNHLKTIGKN